MSTVLCYGCSAKHLLEGIATHQQHHHSAGSLTCELKYTALILTSFPFDHCPTVLLFFLPVLGWSNIIKKFRHLPQNIFIVCSCSNWWLHYWHTGLATILDKNIAGFWSVSVYSHWPQNIFTSHQTGFHQPVQHLWSLWLVASSVLTCICCAEHF